jgi:hypothetical protein
MRPPGSARPLNDARLATFVLCAGLFGGEVAGQDDHAGRALPPEAVVAWT